MSLHDEHLRQALRHAPDSDAAPNIHTRRAVLDYAAKVVSKKPQSKFILQGLWRNISGWPLAGLGSAMAILLVMVVFWDIQPDQTTFDDASSSQVAQAESKGAQKKYASLEDRIETALTPASESLPAAPAAGAVVADAMPKKAKTVAVDKQLNQAKEGNLPAIALAAKPAEVTVVAAAEPSSVAENKGELQTRAEATEEKIAADGKAENAAVLAERTDTLKKAGVDKENDLAKVKAAIVVGESKVSSAERAKTVAAAPESKDEITEARARGAASAAKDIKAGVLRILTLAKPTEGNTPDEATGYRIEAISNRPATEALQAEIDAYNKAMRDWHAK